MQTTGELLRSIPQVGRVEWIGIAPERRADLKVVDEVVARVGTGLEGEHHARRGNSKRQVTLIQAEHLPVIAQLSGHDAVDPGRLRRNVVVSGVNLMAFKGLRFRVGEAVLEGTEPCAPCSLMEHQLGPGGYNAMRNHGGLCTIVVEEGVIRKGDEVRLEE